MGILVVDRLGIRQFDIRQCLDRSFPALLGAQIRMDGEHLFDLPADLHERIHGAHGFLEDDADLIALHLPEERSFGMEHIFSIHKHFSLIGTLLAGKKPRNTHRCDGFSRSRLAHKAQDLSVIELKAHACHGFSVSVMKFHMEISDFQHQSTSLFIL